MSVTPETYQQAKEAMAYLKATNPKLWASLKDASDENTYTFTARNKVYTCGALIVTALKSGWKPNSQHKTDVFRSDAIKLPPLPHGVSRSQIIDAICRKLIQDKQPENEWCTCVYLIKQLADGDNFSSDQHLESALEWAHDQVSRTNELLEAKAKEAGF